MGELQLADPPDNPKRTYDASRCWFRGGHIEPVESLDREFLNACADAARAMTGNPDAGADDFLELLRTHGINSDKWRLRVENAHFSAAHYCDQLLIFPDRYPELLNTAAAELKGQELVSFWSAALKPIQRKFEELWSRDRSAKQEEVDRQNEATAKALPIEKGKHPFCVEFPDQIPILKRQVLDASRGVVEQLETELDSGNILLLSEPNGSLKPSVTLKRAQQYLGCTPRHIQRLVSDGKLTPVGGGQHKQVTVESLLRYRPAKRAT
jgi:hypothetical protein